MYTHNGHSLIIEWDDTTYIAFVSEHVMRNPNPVEHEVNVRSYSYLIPTSTNIIKLFSSMFCNICIQFLHNACIHIWHFGVNSQVTTSKKLEKRVETHICIVYMLYMIMSFCVAQAMYTWMHCNQHKCSVDLLHISEYLYLMYDHNMCSITKTHVSHTHIISPQHMAIIHNYIYTQDQYVLLTNFAYRGY